LSSIGFGTGLAVLFTGIGDSNWREMIDLAARLGGGHVAIQHPETLDSPTFSRTIRDATSLRERALRDPAVTRAVTRISGNIMLMTAGHNRGAGFIAFDPTDEDVETLSLLEAVAEGGMFEESSSSGIILGRRLAEKLDVRLGKKVVYTLTDKHGDIVQEAVRVTGILETGAPSVDGGLALLPIDSLRTALGFDSDEATSIALFLDDQRKAGEVADRLGRSLPPEAAARTWQALSPDLAGFIAMKVASAQFMEVIIMLLVAAGIFNTLFVSVMERLREFGIMLAIGFSPARLFGLVMWESWWLGLCGIALAAFLTAWPYYYLATVGVDLSDQIPLDGSEVAGVAVSTLMRVDIYPENAVMIVAAALLATLLSGIYPAWNAGRVAPVDCIRLA
jgi:ABC-type lipoprotein release transport system permease subunit